MTIPASDKTRLYTWNVLCDLTSNCFILYHHLVYVALISLSYFSVDIFDYVAWKQSKIKKKIPSSEENS